MGCPQRRAMVSEFIPNGLLPNEATSVNLVLDQERWWQAEERSAELIAHIQPNQQSEEHRNAVATYVQRLIMKCFSCQVFTFGSVPLKTYLPDGDIDLSAFTINQNDKDSWPYKVRDLLKREGKSEGAEFHVKEVQCIQSEVKIIKCLVENIVVDISFNQLGGLCTLCFLEEVDNLIRRNHLFKRSIILIKAWCYYESHILGASHGLISTYALETLVLYIFNVYNNTFAGPFEVLYRFLEFFSKFDWDNYCLSLWGPVPISSLPDMRAEPPLKGCGGLLLDKLFLDSCNTLYGGVIASSQENQGHPFVSKYLNIVDPLRANNNLGRSISKGNFFRIRKAFAFGAQQLVRLLDCPEENLIAEFDLFFKNTWNIHRKGHRPDAPSYDLYARNKNEVCQMKNALTAKGQSPKYLSNEACVMHHFDRAHPCPESAHISGEDPPRCRHIGVSEVEKGHSHSRPKVANHNGNVSAESQQQMSYDWRSEDAADSKTDSNSCNAEFGIDVIEEDGCSIGKAINMHKQGQDFMNVIQTYRNRSFSGYLPAMGNVNSSNVPFAMPPPVLASGCAHANSFAINPENPFWGQNIWSQDLVHFPTLQWFTSLGVTLNQEEVNDSVDDNEVLTHLDLDHGDIWYKENMNSARGCNYEDRNILSGSGYYLPKGYEAINGQIFLTRKNCTGDLLDERNKDVYVNSQAMPASHSTSTSDLSSSTLSYASSSKDLKFNMDQRKLFFSRLPSAVFDRHEEKHIEHTSAQPDNASGEQSIQTTVENDLSECTNGEGVASDVQDHHLASYRQGPTSVSNLNIPNISALVGSSPGAVDNEGLLPFAFHSAGSPFPYNTMFPLYNFPPETETNCKDMDAELCDFHAHQLNVSLDSTERTKQSGTFHKPNSNINDATSGSCIKQKSNVLCGNFESYWLNLLYGWSCQNAQLQSSLSYPPYVIPPMYAQGQYPWDGPVRPSSKMNNMAHGPPLVPVMPIQCGSDRHRIYQLYADKHPRYSGGTGNYLPKPESYKKYYQCIHSNDRNQRVNYNYDRKDHPWEKEGNWNIHSKPRFAIRGQFYYQVEGPGVRMDQSNLSNRQPDRLWNSYKHGSFNMGKPYYGSFNTAMPNNHVAAEMPYNIHAHPINSAHLCYTNEATHQGSYNAIN